MAELPDSAEDREQRMMSIRAAEGSSGTWDWDIAGNRLFVDDRFAELYGIDAEKGQGLPVETFFKAIYQPDRARMRIAVAGILGGAELFSKEFRVDAPDGSLLWMHGRGRSHLDENDEPVRFTGLLVDVTDRKRTEERLRIAQTAGGIGTFEYIDGFATAAVSEMFCKLLGLHPANALPIKTINSVILPNEVPIIPAGQSIDPTISQLDAEYRIIRRDDGAERWIAQRGEIIHDRGGYRLVGVIYDITAAKELEAQLRDLNETLEARVEEEVVERHQAQESLRQAQKMEAVGHLTGGIAHDFNNLLTIIIGNIDIVYRRLDSSADPRARRSLENAIKGAERAAALTQRLLAFSRRQPLDPKSIDVGKLLTGMSDLLTRAITETIAILIVAGSDLWRIEADPHQLENAILNLAVNARDAMPGGGTLTIDAANVTVNGSGPDGVAPGEYVAICVTDSGTGMAPDTVAKVFDPFFTTKDVGKGTGLGLSMVHGFANQSGGGVSIASSVGKGTKVTLYLPRISVEPIEIAAQPKEEIRSGSSEETILVVEDDHDVRAYTVGVLRELGYRVIEAYDGASALRLLAKQDQQIQLLVTDVVMPEMSGSVLAETARLTQPNLKVLFNSGYTRDAIMQDGRLEPGVDLISKPFTFESLAAKVRELLDRD